MEVSDLLIEHGSHLNSKDTFDFTPFVYACQSGSTELVENFLDTDLVADLINPDCLEQALEFDNHKVVEILLLHKHWYKILPQDSKSEHFKKLITKMPDKMEIILDKCFEPTLSKYDFSLIDLPIQNTIVNHPLYLIAETKDERLLVHHTVQSLTALKFQTFPKIAFFLDLILYILYCFLVSFVHLVFNFPLDLNNNSTNISSTLNLNDSFSMNSSDFSLNEQEKSIDLFIWSEDYPVHPFIYQLSYICLILVLLIHLSKEIIQMHYYTLRDYFSSVDNWFQLSTLVLTLISLQPYLSDAWRIMFGSFGILYAWISMSFFFQDLQLFNLGRYIVAFRKTIQNSFKFLPFLCLICIGFLLAFKVGEKLNDEKDDSTTNKVNTLTLNASSNFLRIITMMVRINAFYRNFFYGFNNLKKNKKIFFIRKLID